jgi:alpha-ribazole phosphatase
MGVTLWLVRHAVTLAAPGLCYGRLDLPAAGPATRAAAQALAHALPPAIPLRRSPAQRCRQLAEALAELRPDLPAAIVDERLHEMDFGAWEGRPWDAIGAPALAAWTADFAGHAPGGGETVQALLARVGRALADVRAARQPGAWITHAGVIRACRLLARGVERVALAADWPREPVPFGSWETIDLA